MRERWPRAPGKALGLALVVALAAAWAPAAYTQATTNPQLLGRIQELKERIAKLLALRGRGADGKPLPELSVGVTGPDEVLLGEDAELGVNVLGGVPPFKLTVTSGGSAVSRSAGPARESQLKVSSPKAPGRKDFEVEVTDSAGTTRLATISPKYRPVPRRDEEDQPKGKDDAGKGVDASVSVSQGTMWERAKKRIGDLYQAYLGKDVSGVIKQFSPGLSSPPLSVIQTAVMDDFTKEQQTSIGLTMSSYQKTPDGLCASMRWNRNTLRGAQILVHQGNSRVCFDRNQDMKISLMSGTIPFGLFDPLLVKQVAAGNPNPDPDSNTPLDPSRPFESAAEIDDPGAVVGPPPPDPPDPDPPGGTDVIRGEPENDTQTFALDIENGTPRSLGFSASDPQPGDAQPGEDFFLIPGPIGVNTVTVRPIGGARVLRCGAELIGVVSPAQAFQRTYRAINIQFASGDAVSQTFGQFPLFGFQTNEGNFGLLLYDKRNIVFITDNDPILNPNLLQDCPFGT